MASASRAITQILRPIARQATKQQATRTFVTAARSTVRNTNALKVAAGGYGKIGGYGGQQVRGVKTIDFAGTKETVYGMLLIFSGWAMSPPPMGCRIYAIVVSIRVLPIYTYHDLRFYCMSKC